MVRHRSAIEMGKKPSLREVRKLKERVDEIAGLYSVDLIFYEMLMMVLPNSFN